MRTASTDYPDPVPDAPCGIYNDPDDERICVCARDPNQCGKRVPAANLAHPQGKLICCLYITAIVVAIVLSIVFSTFCDTFLRGFGMPASTVALLGAPIDTPHHTRATTHARMHTCVVHAHVCSACARV